MHLSLLKVLGYFGSLLNPEGENCYNSFFTIYIKENIPDTCILILYNTTFVPGHPFCEALSCNLLHTLFISLFMASTFVALSSPLLSFNKKGIPSPSNQRMLGKPFIIFLSTLLFFFLCSFSF